jgi:hypothetical protein
MCNDHLGWLLVPQAPGFSWLKLIPGSGPDPFPLRRLCSAYSLSVAHSIISAFNNNNNILHNALLTAPDIWRMRSRIQIISTPAGPRLVLHTSMLVNDSDTNTPPRTAADPLRPRGLWSRRPKVPQGPDVQGRRHIVRRVQRVLERKRKSDI